MHFHRSWTYCLIRRSNSYVKEYPNCLRERVEEKLTWLWGEDAEKIHLTEGKGRLIYHMAVDMNECDTEVNRWTREKKNYDIDVFIYGIFILQIYAYILISINTYTKCVSHFSLLCIYIYIYIYIYIGSISSLMYIWLNVNVFFGVNPFKLPYRSYHIYQPLRSGRIWHKVNF